MEGRGACCRHGADDERRREDDQREGNEGDPHDVRLVVDALQAGRQRGRQVALQTLDARNKAAPSCDLAKTTRVRGWQTRGRVIRPRRG